MLTPVPNAMLSTHVHTLISFILPQDYKKQTLLLSCISEMTSKCPRIHNKCHVQSQDLFQPLPIYTIKTLGVMNAKICFSSNIWSLSQISRESDYSIYSTLNLQETICIALPSIQLCQNWEKCAKLQSIQSLFSAVPIYYQRTLSKSTTKLIPMTEVIMRTRRMFKHNPFSCNKMMQSFLYLHRAHNLGKQFEIKANFFQQC